MQFQRVEFFGLPGVGKTYLANILFHESPDLESYVLPNTPSTWREKIYDYPFYLRHFSFILQARQESQYPQIMTRFKRIARRKPYLKKHTQCILMDCGLLQPVLEAMLFYQNAQDVSQWQSLFDTVILPNQYYIYIADHLENIVKREYARHRRRFALDAKELLKRYESILPAIEYLKAKISFTQFNRADYQNEQSLIDAMRQMLQKALSLPHTET